MTNNARRLFVILSQATEESEQMEQTLLKDGGRTLLKDGGRPAGSEKT